VAGLVLVGSFPSYSPSVTETPEFKTTCFLVAQALAMVRGCGPWSLRVAVVVLSVVVIALFAVVLFVFFFVWLFSNEDIGS